MLVLEYKVKGKPSQYRAIEEAIKTVQFVRNKCIRYWMDAPKETKIDGFILNKYSTKLRSEFLFVKNLNSMAVQSSAERAWVAISRFYNNCKSKKPGEKGYPRFQKHNRSVEYKTSGWKLHPTKRRITFTDKKGIGELKLLGKWDIHTCGGATSHIKRVRLLRRADGYYCQFVVNVAQCFPHIQLDAFVVMPNHLHGILIITDEGYRALPKNRPIKEQFGKPVPGSIPTVVRSFKSAVTKRINLMRRTKTPPIWQDNYYESIVRVQTGLDWVRQYIINNPRQWEMDKENIKYHSNEILDLGLDF